MTPQQKYAWLRGAGLTVKQIAEQVGCSRDTLERLANGRYIRRDTKDALMAMKLPKAKAKA